MSRATGRSRPPGRDQTAFTFLATTAPRATRTTRISSFFMTGQCRRCEEVVERRPLDAFRYLCSSGGCARRGRWSLDWGSSDRVGSALAPTPKAPADVLEATPTAPSRTDPAVRTPTVGPRVAPARRPRRPLGRRLRWPLGTSLVLQIMLVLGDRLPSVDTISYFQTGRNFVAGNGFTREGSPEMHFPPVAPVSLGFLEKVLGSEMAALRTWNLVWGLAAVLLLTAIGWYLSRDDDVTVATAWFATAVPGVMTYAIKSSSGSELPTLTLLLGSALLVLRTLDAERGWTGARRIAGLVGGGALVGLAYLTRPEALMPGATIGLAIVLIALRQPDRTLAQRLRAAVGYGAAFGLATLLLMAPYVNYTHTNTGSWALTSKTQDASIDAWRAVAQNNRLERDQILYAIQPDGVSLGPDTVPLTTLAKEHPRGWLTIAWINTRTMIHDYVGSPWKYGPVWELIPLFLLVAAVGQMWITRRQRGTLLFAAVGAWPVITCFAFFALPRYLMMTTAVLIPFGAWGLVSWTRRLRPGWRLATWWAVGLLTLLSFIVGAWSLLPATTTPEHTEQRTAGIWLAEHTPKDARVMTRSFHVQGYSERPVVAMPYGEYRSVLEFARRMGVTYIVADETTIKRRRPELYDILMRENGAPVGLKLAHQFTQDGVTVKIYQLDPAAPPTTQPPLPLGYVSD